MKESYGGILNIVFIVFFLVLIEGIFGFIVSYTKAFKMKNSIISVIEKYEGSGCALEIRSSSVGESACRTEIVNEANKLSYSPPSIKCPNGTTLAKYRGKALYCYSISEKTLERKLSNGRKVKKTGDVYKVITQVDISIPLINQIMGLRFFSVSGDTKIIQRPDA